MTDMKEQIAFSVRQIDELSLTLQHRDNCSLGTSARQEEPVWASDTAATLISTASITTRSEQYKGS